MSQVTKDLKLAIGRLIGTAKRKQPSIVDSWRDMCHANGVTPSDRALGLFAWDLEQNGADIQAIAKNTAQSDVEKAGEAVSMANQITQLASQFTDTWIQRESAHRQELDRVLGELKAQRLREVVDGNLSGK